MSLGEEELSFPLYFHFFFFLTFGLSCSCCIRHCDCVGTESVTRLEFSDCRRTIISHDCSVTLNKKQCLFYDGENYFIVIGYKQANLSLVFSFQFFVCLKFRARDISDMQSLLNHTRRRLGKFERIIKYCS